MERGVGTHTWWVWMERANIHGGFGWKGVLAHIHGGFGWKGVLAPVHQHAGMEHGLAPLLTRHCVDGAHYGIVLI